MIVLKKMDILKAKNELEGILAMIQQAAQEGIRIDLVEKDLWQRLLRLGRVNLQAYIHAQGTGDLGPTLSYDGRERKRLEGVYPRRYVSIFGGIHPCPDVACHPDGSILCLANLRLNFKSPT